MYYGCLPQDIKYINLEQCSGRILYKQEHWNLNHKNTSWTRQRGKEKEDCTSNVHVKLP